MFRKIIFPTKCNLVWKTFIFVIAISMLVSGCGGPKPKVFRVGILSGLEFVADITDGFKEKMTELGYVEGENIIYDVQRTDFDMEAYKRILNKFVEDKVDLIVAFPTEATMEAKYATQGTNIPVLFTFALVEGMGIIDSVSAPGGNITGVRYPGPEIVLKRFEILLDLVPQAKRIWLPYQKDYPIVAPQLEALYPAAEKAGITLIEAPANNAEELQAIIDELEKSGDIEMDAILFLVEPLVTVPEAFMVVSQYAYKHNVPLGGVYLPLDTNQSIFGLNVNSYAIGKDAAPLADKILKGTQAGTIPVISAENFLQIDVNAAKSFGITIPDGLLLQANEVIR